MTGVHTVRFSPKQKLPPGYRVVWSEGLEHYMWLNGERESAIFCDRFMAYRDAWCDWAERRRAGGAPTQEGE